MQEKVTNTMKNVTDYHDDINADVMSLDGFIYCIRHDVEAILGKSVEVSLQQVTKNNNVRLQAILIKPVGCNVASTIYLNALYERYCQGMNLEDVVENVIETYQRSKVEESLNIDFFMDWEQVKERIIFKLVNYERNTELLNQIPSKSFLDMAIIFQVMVGDMVDGNATITIRNEHLTLWEKEVNDLYEMAMLNTPRLLEVEIQSMVEILMGLSPESIPECFEMDESAMPMYVISNKVNVNGAGVIIYPGVLRNFTDRKGFENMIILPSSTHEAILVPVSSKDEMECMSEMVRSVNQTQLTEEEILSDHSYFYSREDDEITF